MRLLSPDDETPDANTLDWLATEIFPYRALLAEERNVLALPPVPDEPPSELTADWLQAQEFPARPLLYTDKPAPGVPVYRRRPAAQREQLGFASVRVMDMAVSSGTGWWLEA